VGFKSDWYDGLIAEKKIAIVKGIELRVAFKTGGSGTPIESVPDIRAIPELNYQELFTDISRIYNLVQLVGRDSDGLFVRWEEESFRFNSGVLFTLTDVKDVERSSDSSRLFSKLELGSVTAITNDLSLGLGHIRLFDFDREDFYFQGICNTDRALDLTQEVYVSDSNVIQDVLIGGSDAFDDKLFFIQYSNTGTGAVQTDPFSDGSTIYNQEHMNNLIVERYDLQGSIAKELPANTLQFRAERVAGDPFVLMTFTGASGLLLAFGNDFTPPNFDSGGNYTPAPTYRYTAPDSGSYTFEAVIKFELVTQTFTFPQQHRITISRFSAADVLLSSATILLEHTGEGIYTDTLSTNFYMNATDYAQVDVFQSGVNFIRWPVGSTFRTLGAFNGGGIYIPKDSGAYRVTTHRFKRSLTEEQILALLAEPFKRIVINQGEGNINTHARNISVNLYTNEVEFEVISNEDNS